MDEIQKDDQTLLERFCDRACEASFAELVRRYLPLAFAVARRRLGSAALAEEAAQGAFLRLAAKADKVARHPQRIAAWLQRTAYLEACAISRKEARLSRVPISEPEKAMDRPEIHDRLDEALARLSEPDRELVLRHCCGGEGYARLAAISGLTPAACQKRVERTLARLARVLGKPNPIALVIAGFGAATMKAEAIPSPEAIAAAVLKSHSATATAVGFASGLKITACATLAAAGGYAGWQLPPQASTAHAVAPLNGGGSLSTGTSSPVSSTRQVATTGLPHAARRSLDEVLESIQAGRLGPLVEFLPQAKVDDLRAILAEDDIASRNEGSWTFGTAHGLAMRRWAEIAPAEALAYAIRRDQEGVVSGELSSRVMTVWMSRDPRAAADAFLALAEIDRLWIAKDMVDESSADRLLLLDPSLEWIVLEARERRQATERRLDEAKQRVASFLAGPQEDEVEGADAWSLHVVASSFHRLASEDFDGTLALAQSIRPVLFRIRVLQSIHRDFGDEPSGMPTGPLRTELMVRVAERRMVSAPEAVIRELLESPVGPERDGLMEVVARVLAGTDPWRMLEICGSLEGRVLIPSEPLEAALEFAGRTDPQRALRMLPQISARIFTDHGGPRRWLDFVFNGWLERDCAAAIRWAAEAGLEIGADRIQIAVNHPRDLAPLFSEEDPKILRMAHRALIPHLLAAHHEEKLANLLAMLPAEAAWQALGWLAGDLSRNHRFDEAWQVAEMVPRDHRERDLLPSMALGILREDHPGGREWLAGLPARDRKAIVVGLRHWLDGDGRQTFNRDELLETLERIAP